MSNVDFKAVQSLATEIRKDIIAMTYKVGGIGAHIGGSLSLCEIIAALFSGVINLNKENLPSQNRDHLIISKGHGVMALYSLYKQFGIISQDELDSFKKDGSWLTAHPTMNNTRGFDFSSGSLGHGLSLAVGAAWGLKLKENVKDKYYVILGDGECNEGSVWEGAMAAVQLKLDNLVVILDKNGLQFDDKTENIISMESMEAKWKAFGWNVAVVNGHNVEELYNALSVSSDKPYIVIAKTVKGKGVSFIENDPKWHLNHLTKNQYELALQEQE